MESKLIQPIYQEIFQLKSLICQLFQGRKNDQFDYSQDYSAEEEK